MQSRLIFLVVIVFAMFLSSCDEKSEEVECDDKIEDVEIAETTEFILNNVFYTPETELVPKGEDKWIRPTNIDEVLEPPNYFLCNVPYDVIVQYLPDLERAAAGGTTGFANSVIVGGWDFYRTGESTGFLIRYFAYLTSMGWGVYEISYVDKIGGYGYHRIYLSQRMIKDRISNAISDGEFLYYMHSDRNLRRIDKTGEIKSYPVFEEEDDFYIRHSKIEAEGNEIIVTSSLPGYKSAVVDVSS